MLLISFWLEFWFVNVVPKYSNSSTLSMELLSTFIVWLSPAVCSRDITMYLVSSAFTSSPISLIATTRASTFSLNYYYYYLKGTSQNQQENMCIYIIREKKEWIWERRRGNWTLPQRDQIFCHDCGCIQDEILEANSEAVYPLASLAKGDIT